MAIEFVEYNPDEHRLVVMFTESGRRYEYMGVPKDVAEGFEMAAASGVSVGRYFHKYIKNYPSMPA